MSISTVLYNLIIQPLEYLLELVFVLMNRFLGQPAYAVIALSVVVGLLTAPLYRAADRIQSEERNKQKEMKPWLEHIRQNFRGDERFMMRSAYYSICGYRPLLALRGALPLLLQIPFFLAAYRFMSGLESLHGAAFGPITDLGAEDGLLMIAGMRINLLPILMTLINVISSMIYTRGFEMKDRLQPILLALIFLLLLYKSPSGLVLYWLLNNVFSLIRNLLSLWKTDKKKLLRVVLILTDLLYILFICLAGHIRDAASRKDYELLLFYILIAALPPLCMFGAFLKKKGCFSFSFFKTEQTKDRGKSFLLTEYVLAVLMGGMIPLMVVSSSPLDFVDSVFYYNPLRYVLTCACVSAGLFLIWGSVIYKLLGEQGRRYYELVTFLLIPVTMLNLFFFKANTGVVTRTLQFEKDPVFTRTERLMNLALILLMLIVSYLFMRRFFRIWKALMGILALALSFVCVFNVIRCNSAMSDYQKELDAGEKAEIPISRNGKNVIVIMLDRAISSYIPFCFEEKKELYEEFSGFVYYPNTVSYGEHTHIGAPSIFGGYEYTPTEMNRRSSERLVDKHDEALKVMPLLFGENGYRVSVCDPPIAGYSTIPDLSLYEGYPYINAFHLESFKKEEGGLRDGVTALEGVALTERNLWFYSFFRAAPALLQGRIYDGGMYLASGEGGFSANPAFMDTYLALKSVESICRIEDTDENTFYMMNNHLTHEPNLTQLPDYTLPHTIDNSAYEEEMFTAKEVNGIRIKMDNSEQVSSYHVNMAALLILGDWFSKLKAEGVYDNTRIIIVSDHGAALKQREDMILEDGYDVMAVNPLLFFKDFDAEGDFVTDKTFMTTADVPVLAMQGLVKEMKNPLTGKEINMNGKEDGADIDTEYSVFSMNSIMDSKQFSADASWYHVDDDIFDPADWTKIK